MSVCNKDCFHCPYPDCINDEMDYADYKESAQREKLLNQTSESRGKSAYREELYVRDRDKKLAYYREHYAKNRDRYLAYYRKHYAKNRNRALAYQRDYYAKNRDEIAAKKKVWYQLKKARMRNNSDRET